MLLSFVAILAMVMLTPATASKSKTYPRLSAAEKKDRILIVAPHIDDEAISAGGYTIDAIANGAEVYVVFLTAGDCNQFSARLLHKTLEPTASNYLSVGKTRIAEAKEAMKILGVTPDHFFILGYPDRGLRTMVDNPDAVVRSRGTRAHEVPYDDALSPGSQYKIENALNDLKQVIATARPTTVIAPVPFDKHPDHAAAAEIVDVALEDMQWKATRLGYLVHSRRIKSLVNSRKRALLPPNKLKAFSWATYPLSEHAQQMKDNALMTYKSQQPYLLLLRNTFVRQNELFFVYPTALAESELARITSAR
ncbi:MAG TPA: PIG-L family deacetylase [Thermoanaerobaculia bacterium]|nr:PIG-L family deacetylase [Thermoanaerobaculia bacterium]